jgi:glycosyltransferase involved in cell wall biosynthesis
MKLLCVTPSYFPAFKYGGPITSVHALNKALVKKGMDVNVYTTTVGLEEDVPATHEINVDGVRVYYFAFTKLFEFLGATGWQFSWSMTRALKRNLKAFDLIYIVSVWNYPTAASAHYCREYKKPYIISPQGALYPYTFNRKIWKKLPYYHGVAKRDIQSATAIHYLTEDEAKRCHSYLDLKNQRIVIPNGIDMSEFNFVPERKKLRERYRYPINNKVILFLGRIHWIKGLDILSKAFGKLARERNDVHLLIVGSGGSGDEKKMRRLFREEGALDSVTFTGALRGKEKLEAFAGSHLFVLPSYSETFSMAILEAMICGLPVVITRQCNFPEIQTAKAGLIINPDGEDLYHALVKVLDNEKEATEMGSRGKKLVEECYTIDKVADRMLRAYEEVVENVR